MPTCRHDRVHGPPVQRISHPVPDAPCAPLRRVRSATVHPTRRHGRPYRPPLRPRLGFSRRGRCPHRPAAPGCKARPPHRCGRRAACPHAAMTGYMDRRSSVYRTRFRTRHARPYDGCVRRRCIRHGGTGGHTGRPYGPASGFLVGTAFHIPYPPAGAKCTAPKLELCILHTHFLPRYASRGKVTVMAVPLPSVLWSSTRARWNWAACFTIDRPRPVPETSSEWLLSTR